MYQILFIFSILSKISANTYSVKIGTDSHINLIDDKFLSFTIDPKYLFSSSEKYRSKECLCMASSLSPAYIRIAGPSTALLSFHNATITIDEPDEVEPVRFQDQFADQLAEDFKGMVKENRFKRNHERIEVSHKEWRKFVQWSSSSGFELVFALNNEEKMSSGLWDPNTALNILTVAEKAGVGDIFWQLGYECKNQSIEEYLTDLETLRVITETFLPGQEGRWKVVGGDVTHCLDTESKSDFKDYVMLSDDLMDAILLNGNSSTVELSRMSPRDRMKLLRVLSASSTPLWLTEPNTYTQDQLVSAVDWLTGLGHAATNGFSHHFRELGEDMYQPSLSFYMALLFKNLVGSKVLSVDMDPDQAIMFAHCTALRHEAVPGAVTLYGANLDEEPARFSVKLAKMEDGGDIMQFVMGLDSNGNIQVNGRPMYFEGDLKPVVKRVRPYKTLVINLPARSFGFWVLANTKVKACYEENKQDSIETLSGESQESVKVKRSINDFEEYVTLSDVSIDFFDNEDNEVTDNNIVSKMTDVNEDLNKVQELFKNNDHKRSKRQAIEERISEIRRKLRRHGITLRNNKKVDSEEKPKSVIGNLFQLTRRNLTRNYKNGNRRATRFLKNKVSKRNPHTKNEEIKLKVKKIEKPKQKTLEKSNAELVRTRRSIDNSKINNKIKADSETSAENEVFDAPADKAKLWKILKNIHKELRDLSEENEEYMDEDNAKTDSQEDGLFANESGLIKNTVGNLMKVLSDLNKNLHRFWDTINLLD